MSDSVRHLCLILGDQLNLDSQLFDGFDPHADRLLMMEVSGESVTTASGFQRTVLFLSAMRHFAEELRGLSLPLIYQSLEQGTDSFSEGLKQVILALKPERLRVVLPGDYRVLQEIRDCCHEMNLEI